MEVVMKLELTVDADGVVTWRKVQDEPPVEPPVEPEPPVEEPTDPPVEEPPEEPEPEEPEPEPPEPTPPPAEPREGIWIDHDALMALPTNTPAWEAVLDWATSKSASGANVANQDSTHSRATLAMALAGVRGQDNELIDKATAALTGAIGTEEGARWLAIGRNLGAYIIAADILDIRSGPIFDWLRNFRTRTLKHNNSGNQITLRKSAWESGSNASSQEGFVYSALNAYLGDTEELKWCWDAFRRYCGDRSSPHTITSNDDSWQEYPNDPVGIQNKGATKNGINIDGAVSNDMSRGGTLKDPPGYTLYPWVGLNGAAFAALVLHRQGYPAFDIQDKALLRATIYLRKLGDTFWGKDKKEDAKWVLTQAYNLPLSEYPINLPVSFHDLIGWVDATHWDGI